MKISVIIPTLNEEEQLPPTIRHIRETANLWDTEIIVVDAESSDRTLTIAESMADRVEIAKIKGRGAQLHQGAAASTGELLLFLHADTILPQNWQEALQRAWIAPIKPPATAFRLGFDDPSLFFRFLALIDHWKTLATRVPYGDQAIAIAREVYFEIGGFPPVPLFEEQYLFKRLKPFGIVRILPEKVLTSARRYKKNGPLFNACQNLILAGLFSLGVSPKFLARIYK